jgi:D-alanyl-D-alanine carboxypeptidase
MMHAALVDVTGTLHQRCADEAVVPWWSFTKTLIAAAVLRLAEAGRLDLDVPFGRHPFTPRQLLQHRAGLGDYGGLATYRKAVARDDDPWPEEVLLRQVPPDRLLFPPGSAFAYSNVGYLLLRHLVEECSGTPFAAALSGLVLDPLGLKGARLARTRADMASTAFSGGTPYHPVWVFHGVVVGPVAEAALALHRLLNGHLLLPASRAALLAAMPVGGAPAGRPWQITGYGLGLMIGTMQHPPMKSPLAVVGHSAGGPGSVGAVYHAPFGGDCRTAAVFAAGADEGPVEHAALRLLTSSP